MKISIKKGWLGRYQIYTEDSNEYSFSVRSGYMLFRGDYAKIFNRGNRKEILITQKVTGAFWRLNRTAYVIDFLHLNETLEIKCVNYLLGHWTFNFQGASYDLFVYSNSWKALYKNDVQVAKYRKLNDVYDILANNDENRLLIISLFITFNMGDSTVDDDVCLITNNAPTEVKAWQPI
jgi:hypothetical protein